MKPRFIQTFDDIAEIQEKTSSTLSSAKQEILGIFSTNDNDSNLLLGLKDVDQIRIIAPDNNPPIKELKQGISTED